VTAGLMLVLTAVTALAALASTHAAGCLAPSPAKDFDVRSLYGAWGCGQLSAAGRWGKVGCQTSTFAVPFETSLHLGQLLLLVLLVLMYPLPWRQVPGTRSHVFKQQAAV
jgi:hypothetical protein